MLGNKLNLCLLRKILEQCMLMICTTKQKISRSLWLTVLRVKILQQNSVPLVMPFWYGHKVWLTVQERAIMVSICCSMFKSLVAESANMFQYLTIWFKMWPGSRLVRHLLLFLEFNQPQPLCMIKTVHQFLNSANAIEIRLGYAHFHKLPWLEVLETWQVKSTFGHSINWPNTERPRHTALSVLNGPLTVFT